MKKFLIVLSCVALLLPVVALSAFAEDSYSISFTNGYNEIRSFYLSLSSDSYGSPQRVSSSASVFNTIVPGVLYKVRCSFSNGSTTLYPAIGFGSDVFSLTTLSSDISDPTIIDPDLLSSSSLYDRGTLDTTPVDYYFMLPAPPPPDPYQELGIDDGVSAAIGFTGSVLNFITGPRVIIFVVLSIVTSAIIPFAIRKIKSSIKGY